MYAALHIPRFALQSALRTEEGLASRPVVLVSQNESRPRIEELTRAAEKEGVVVGLLVPQALARCGDLLIRYRSPQAEEMAWDALFHCAYSISPRVERMSSGLCLVDLRGVNIEKAKNRCAEIVEELAALGLLVRIGVAASSSLAMLAAKQKHRILVVDTAERISGSDSIAHVPHRSFLDSLPIEAAELGISLLDVLRKWGIRTVGAFAALKRDSVGAKLGMEGLLLWDQVNGRDERVVGVTELAPVFEESWEFEYEVDSVEPLLFILRRFLDQLSLKLGLAHKVATEVFLELGIAYGDPIGIRQKIPEPTRDQEALFRLLSGRVEDVETDSPVVRFSIHIEAIDFKQRQFGIFESSLKNPYRFAQTLARVTGIVGSDRVGRPVLEADGRPDGFRLEQLPSSVDSSPESSLKNHYAMAMRRFRPGLQAAVELQGRQPVWFKSEHVSGFVKACRGPWLYSGHWWEKNGGWNRVEWDVELRKGGIYRLAKDADGWKLEGEYD